MTYSLALAHLGMVVLNLLLVLLALKLADGKSPGLPSFPKIKVPWTRPAKRKPVAFSEEALWQREQNEKT
jgi:hypothetical protein